MIEQVSIQAFQDRLREKSAALRIPFDVTVEMTYGCNLRCVHCYNPTHQALPEESSASELYQLLDQIADLGAAVVTFTGGEIFTRPDVWEILSYAKRAGLQIHLYTNATLLDDDKIQKLKDLSPQLVSVSIYGMTEATYETVTGVPGSFRKFWRTIPLLKASGIPLNFKMPVMTLNRHELEDAYRWFEKEGLPFIHSVEIHPRVDGNISPLKYRLTPDQAAALRFFYEDPPSCRLKNSPKNNSQNVFSCSCGKNSFAVTPYGEMNLCVTTYYPKYPLRTRSLREGWKVLVEFVGTFSPSPAFECRQCEFVSHCSQGPMDAFLNTGDFNPCLPYFKETAREMKNLSEKKK